MGVLSTTIDFSNGDQVTSSSLDQIIGGSTFNSSAVYDQTLVVTDDGKLRLGTVLRSNVGAKSIGGDQIDDNAIGSRQIGPLAVPTGAIQDLAVTNGKLGASAVTIPKVDSSSFANRAAVETPAASLIVTPDLLKYHPGIAKAYGVVALAPSDASISGSYNVTSASVASATSRAVVLGITMANTDYVVIATYIEGSSIGASPSVENRTTTGFTIYTAPQAAGRKVQFSVFGKLAP